jgi:hypothetical protein
MSTSVQTATEIRPFHVDIPEEKLAELRRPDERREQAGLRERSECALNALRH